jgi:4a-hydroxytetrahydrobiopterin dehydratase
MKSLAKKKGVPTKNTKQPLKGEDLAKFKKQLRGGWKVIRGHHLEKEYKFKDFLTALGFVNRVGREAEKMNHHPDIYLAWGKVKMVTFDHHTDGLIESDFVLAAKADAAFK